MNRSIHRTLLVCILISAPLCGCGQRAAKTQQEPRPMAFSKKADDLVIMVVLDLSPNFKAKLLGKDFREQGGPAYACLQQILSALHQERSGQRDTPHHGYHRSASRSCTGRRLLHRGIP